MLWSNHIIGIVKEVFLFLFLYMFVILHVIYVSNCQKNPEYDNTSILINFFFAANMCECVLLGEQGMYMHSLNILVNNN